MAKVPLPSQAFLRECFLYDPETGLFHWRHRPASHFATPEAAQSWNVRQAGTRAFVWADDGYYRCEVTCDGKRHRLRSATTAYKMMTGLEPEMVDHRDLNTRNDRFDNLRASDRFGNRHNAPGNRNHPLPKGVSYDRGKFIAKGAHKGHKLHLGTFRTPAAAHEAYCAWARPIHGEFFNAGPEKQSVFN